jgi:hypothetical protein
VMSFSRYAVRLSLMPFVTGALSQVKESSNNRRSEEPFYVDGDSGGFPEGKEKGEFVAGTRCSKCNFSFTRGAPPSKRT